MQKSKFGRLQQRIHARHRMQAQNAL